MQVTMEMPEPPEGFEYIILRKKRWRASEYRFVGSYGGINTAYDDSTWLDDTRYRLGNYFHTDEEARASKFYKVFHGEEGQ